MTLVQAARVVSTSAQFVPLQFGGGFIELAILFLVLAVVVLIFGRKGVAGLSMDIAKRLLIIFIVLATISFVL
jgi:uncharacterized membrane protein YtjA (UPF0391 family)